MSLWDWVTVPAMLGLRITFGVAGFALMGAGMLAIDFFGWAVGLPVFLVGALMTTKAIF